MNSVLLFLGLALTCETTLGASLPQKESGFDDSNMKNNREDRQFWLPAEETYADYLNNQETPADFGSSNWPYYRSGYGDTKQPISRYHGNPSLNDRFTDNLYNGDQLARQNAFGLSNINSAVNSFQQLFAALPKPFILNPNQPFQYPSCKDADGKSGICTNANLCTKYGGSPSGPCLIGNVCCVNTISKCGGQISLNNTYWESPAGVSSESTCTLTITLDNNLFEQKIPICQVRLDIKTFRIAQPSATSKCDVDKFTVGGSVNKVPVICGDNPSQHMYLEAASARTSMMLIFSFGTTPLIRSWNMKISLLPCGASYLAPRDCLQYFTAAAGSVRSFNWIDAPGMRQLSNQEYKICFRTELVNEKRTTRNCYTKCTTTLGGNSYAVSGAAGGNSAVGLPTCVNDYLLIPNAFNALDDTKRADRFCGGAFNPTAAAAASVSICSTMKDFSFTYVTNDVETGDTDNTGFCFTFEQRFA